MPKVVDLTEDEARSTLEALGFKVAVKEQETEDSARVGEVVLQDPAASANRAKGSTVTITVGKEPAEVDVPDVTGQGRLAATAALKKAGFEVTADHAATGDRAQDLHVISQDPSGAKAKKGITVTITVRPVRGDPGPGDHDDAERRDAGQHGDHAVRVAVLGGGRSPQSTTPRWSARRRSARACATRATRWWPSSWRATARGGTRGGACAAPGSRAA